MTRLASVLAALFFSQFIVQASAQNPIQLVLECDRLAAADLDPERPANVPGVVRVDAKAAVPACVAAAKAAPTNRRMMYQLGRALAASKQHDKARGAYQFAAKRGHALAAVNLGLMFANGIGGEKNLAEARRLYERAAAAGHPAGMRLVAGMYETGAETPKDEAQAQAWNAKARAGFMKLAGGGNAAAMFQLGVMIEYGRGGPRDVNAARLLYQKAAAVGHEPAKSALERLSKSSAAPPRTQHALASAVPKAMP